jgi:hypothetical protein
MNEIASLCKRRVRGVGQLHVNSPLHNSPFIEFTKQDRFTVYLPPKVRASEGLLEFINSIVLPQNDKMISSIYVKMIYLDEGEVSVGRSINKVTEEVMREFALEGTTKPFTFYRIQVTSKVTQ